MQYALVIYEDEALYGEENTPAWREIFAQHEAFAGELAQKGVLRGGAGLKPTATATTVRRVAGQCSLHDGPYAESKEQLGGFYVIEAPDLDAALAWARKLPMQGDGSVEVRPIIDGTT
ncbi:YciI family protein [Caulobacter sp. UNC358MFTsu5.1]|uniref:YciI family protein n=1 Tax=Caulobacter sp. UNC358MFTsu5.1 TaxID=1449049 RepID=UPI0004A6B8B4|nr:YciI family protein [Caulobacter sp. UNC358MFTsu5.1]